MARVVRRTGRLATDAIPASRRWPRRVAAIGCCLVVLAGCTGARRAAFGPGADQGPVTQLWTTQLSRPHVSDGQVVGVLAGANSVRAVEAKSGRVQWTVTLAGKSPFVMDTVIGGGVVMVLAGTTVGRAPGLVRPIVTSLVVLDAGTGRRLWGRPIAGQTQAFPLAIDAGLVLVGGAGGTVTAFGAMTGRSVWQHGRPAGCGQRRGMVYDEGIAADGAVLAVSWQCADGQAIAQRLDPVTGHARWSWRSIPPLPSGSYLGLAVVGVAQLGGVVVLTGQIGFSQFTNAFEQSIPRAYTWPSSLTPDGNEIEVALDAASGRARWVEHGAQQADVVLSDGASCEVVNTGVACRDDLNGALTRPPLLTGQPADSGPPSTGWAGITGGLICVTEPVSRPDTVRIVITSIRGARVIAQADLVIGTVAFGGARYQNFVNDAAPLSTGPTLLLLQRIDLAGYPLLALKATVTR